MAGKNGMAAAAPLPNEIIEILHVRGDGQGSHATAALKGLEHMPPLPQFSSEWRNVPGGCGPAVQCDDRLGPDPVLTHDKIDHAICRRQAE